MSLCALGPGITNGSSSPTYPGVRRERVHPVCLGQKQSNQPVLGLIFIKFRHSAPRSTPLAWNPAYASGHGDNDNAYVVESLINT